MKMSYKNRMASAIEANKYKIAEVEKQLKKYCKEELVELAISRSIPYEHKKISWLRYDIAIKCVTGYTSF